MKYFSFVFVHATTTIKTVSIDKMATIQREVFEMTGALMDHHMQEQFCGISGEPIILGSSVARYDQAEYDAAVREMSKVLNVSEDLTHYILDQTPRGAHTIGRLCLYEMFFSKPSTQSGRVIKPVMRIGERKEVAGSGFVGADHYDRGFDHGAHRQGGFGDGLHLNRDLKGFVVHDDAPMEVIEDDKDEKEWSSDDEESDEGEWEGDGMETEEESEYEESDDESSEDEGIGCNKCYACVSGGSHPCQGPDPDYYDSDGNPLEDEDYCLGCETGADCASAHSDACNRERGFM